MTEPKKKTIQAKTYRLEPDTVRKLGELCRLCGMRSQTDYLRELIDVTYVTKKQQVQG